MRIIVLIFALMIIATVAFSQQLKNLKYNEEALRIAQTVAEEAMKTFSLLINEKNSKSLGFDNPEQLHQATLGIQIQELMIRLDELKKYEAGQDPFQLIHNTGRLTFPVLVREQTLSSITLSRKGENWEVISFGGPNNIRMLNEMRAKLAKEEGLDLSDYFEVRVPSLNVTFLARTLKERLLLTPLFRDPSYEFESGMTLPADAALMKLVPAARKHDGLPT